MRTLLTILTVLTLAACGGAPVPEDAAADSAVALDPAEEVIADPAPPPPAREPVPDLPRGGEEPPPSRQDSLAAQREDVSPEWKMRERQMASYATCMRQARGGDGEVLPALAAACANLPDAPR